MTDVRIRDLGELTGPLLAFGGVYSNWQALVALRQRAREAGWVPAQIICTGDTVAYCARPEECVQSLREWGVHSIAGNVEIQLGEGQADCACDFVDGGRCDTFSRQWYPYAQGQLSEGALEWMRGLPEFLRFEYGGKRVLVLHGSYHYTSEFIFASTDWSGKARNFDDGDADLIIAGHCGLPFAEEKDGRTWLNPGVIGMPANDGSPRVWYLELDLREGEVVYQHRALEYDFQQAGAEMLERGLPRAYAETLRTGLWDNCEILPSSETARQGQVLAF